MSQHVAQTLFCARKLYLVLQTHAFPFSSCSMQKHAVAGALDTHPCFVCAVYSFVARLDDREILVTLCCWWSPECSRFINQAIV